MATKRRKKTPKRKKTSLIRLLMVFLLKLSIAGVALSLIPLIYLDATIQVKFEGRRWTVPAKVYARPLELYSGAPLLVDDFVGELKKLGYRSAESIERPGTFRHQNDYVLLHTRGFQFWDGYEKPMQVKLVFQEGRLVFLESLQSQSPLSLVRLEPLIIGGIFPAHNEDRELVKLEQVPARVIDTLIAVEDRSFYRHHGISLRGFARAMWVNLKSLSLRQGGSTITQQLIKNFYLSNDRTISRKLIEMPMAVLLDAHYEKDLILETYINEVYLGQAGNRAIHGFGLASRFYFGQPLTELDLHQVALLVALVKGPGHYNPRRHPERALSRRNVILDVLVAQNLLSEEQAQKEKAKPLDVVEIRMLSKSRYPAYLDLVKRQIKRDYREEDLTSEGLRIFTNLDPIIQKQAEISVKDTLDQLEKRYRLDANSLQSAMVVSSVDTGEVHAVVGDRNGRFHGFNRALDANRQIGSLMKPVVYLTALESKQYSLISLLDDSPFSLKNPHGGYWEPKNYDHKNHGMVPLYLALAKSYNVSTTRLGVDVGVDNVLAMLRDLGINKDVNPYPSSLLGAIELSPFEVTQLYQTIASDGFRMPLRAIRDVLTATGEPLNRYPYQVTQVVGSEAVYTLHYAMQQTMQIGTGRSVYTNLAPNFAVAGKTGTTNDSRDSWFAGFTNDKLAVVWVGRDDNHKTPLSGSSGALRVWTKMIKSIHDKNSLEHPVPEEVQHFWVNEQFQAITDPHCNNAKYLPFIVGTEPSQKVDCMGDISEVPKNKKSWFGNIFN